MRHGTAVSTLLLPDGEQSTVPAPHVHTWHALGHVAFSTSRIGVVVVDGPVVVVAVILVGRGGRVVEGRVGESWVGRARVGSSSAAMTMCAIVIRIWKKFAAP